MLQCKHAQEFSFGPRALKDALISTNPALQELYAKAFSRAEKLFLSEAYNPQRTLFCTLLIRTAFDWLLSHPDAPEDFETFYHAMLRRKQNFYRKHIYLQPIDLIEGPGGLSLLDSLQSCVESFFLGLRVKCLPSIPISSIHCCYRHSRDSDRVQLHADGILNFLKNNKPMDALCVLGLTLLDLYPCETWSFTFSKFLPGQEVGVCSFARFSGDFPQAGCSSLNPLTQKERLCEVSKESRDQTLPFSAQEMVQCCKGALSLDEALLRPLEPCPICLRKLQHIVGFKLVERYRKLYAWTQTVLSTWPRQGSADLSASEDILPFSSDSGMCCENDSEAVTSLSEPLTPDTCSQALSIGQELEQDEHSCSLAEAHSQPQLTGPTKSTDIIKDYELWLEMCIAALERNVSEEELAQVDKTVDALAKWEMFTGQLPAMKKDLPFARDNTGLRKVLGDKFSSLRRKLSSRKLSKGESSPHRWRWEEN
ncbi:archaemetzincin-1 isoform X2 [Gymnogyps californianus]|uniref:archaemetzincin-1 isoform X2 n=1 Tax=Gymnogyps californianus TaxID=33616 RepID=UPI0021C5BCAB|nr:archaemetzincin-1 isoform X2 [Gymnogyps californianus]